MILVNSPNKEGDGIISCPQMKFPVHELSYILLNCWPKSSKENLHKTQFVAKTIGCSAQTSIKTPLLKTIVTQRIDHEEIKLVPTKNLHAWDSLSVGYDYVCLYQIAPLRAQGTSRMKRWEEYKSQK